MRPVRYCVVVFDRSSAVDQASFKQHGFGQCGLAAVVSPYKYNILYVFFVVYLHNSGRLGLFGLPPELYGFLSDPKVWGRPHTKYDIFPCPGKCFMKTTAKHKNNDQGASRGLHAYWFAGGLAFSAAHD